MRIGKLAAGLAVGYVLGARAGREKYDRIAAAARHVSGTQSEPAARTSDAGSVTTAALAAPAGSITTAAVAPPAEAATPSGAGDKPRRKRNRRPKAATATTANDSAATSTVDLGDGVPMEAPEADVVEQNTPVVDRTDDPALAPVPLESDAADVSEQRRS